MNLYRVNYTSLRCCAGLAHKRFQLQLEGLRWTPVAREMWFGKRAAVLLEGVSSKRCVDVRLANANMHVHIHAASTLQHLALLGECRPSGDDLSSPPALTRRETSQQRAMKVRRAPTVLACLRLIRKRRGTKEILRFFFSKRLQIVAGHTVHSSIRTIGAVAGARHHQRALQSMCVHVLLLIWSRTFQ